MKFFIGLIFCLALGSCFKVPVKIEEGKELKISKYAKMPSVANEISGMVEYDDGILFLNDGGNGPFLYQLSNDGLDSIDGFEIEGVENIDWEALTYYKDEIVIGDFGNNLGARKDLNIIHLDIDSKKVLSATSFAYPDQTIFEDPRHNFDCEAIVIQDEEYILFTKNRGNDLSNIYSSPVYESNFELIDTIDLEGMVTDAIYLEEKDVYVLLCYKLGMAGFKNSLALVERKGDGDFRTTNIFNIGPAEQFESIMHIENNQFLIASELGFLGNGRHLYLVTIEGL